ncbi:hypothetical protein VTO58DRAFT_104068 [Aureobasidium pullulans]|nr:hypothetical protein JADG_007801 [Aureobasidium pullulans]
MTRRHPVNNPDAAEASRQSWERFTWLSGLLRESEYPALYRTVHAYYGQHPAQYGAIDAMPVLRLKYGVVTIQWATVKQHKRRQLDLVSMLMNDQQRHV